MLSAILALALAAAPLSDTTHLVLVATTDVHGHATAWDYVGGKSFPGGLTRAATIIDSLRARYRGEVLVVDAGDLIQGDPLATYFATMKPRDPHPVLEAMNVSGYDAATPGNHDFDYGVDFMRRALGGATFPYVSGNIFTLPGDTLLYPPYVILPRAGVRVAIAGFTTPGVMVWDQEHLSGRLRVVPIGRVAARVLADMRKDADVAIVLIHSGMDGRASYDTAGVGDENVAASLAALPSKPDVVIVGHSHREMRDSMLHGVHFVQPKPYGQSVSVVHIDLVRTGRNGAGSESRDASHGRWKVISIRGELVPTAEVAPSATLAKRLAPAHAAVLDWVNTPLGEAGAPMLAGLARAEPTPLLSFINAVQRQHTGADLSAAAAFNLRAGFRQGQIRLADVAAIYPYENTLRAIRISGAQLTAYLEQSARYYAVDSSGRVALNDSIPGYNYDVVSGASYEIDLRRPPGSRIRNLAVRHRAVEPTDSFTLAINSYRQAGGGGFAMLKGAPVVYDRGENVRDLLVDAIRKEGRLDPAKYAEENWRIVPEEAADAIRQLFGGATLNAGDNAPADSTALRILTIGDFHGALLARVQPWSGGRPVGGAAALKAWMDSAEAACGCPTLRLDAGDEMQGTVISNLVRGRSTIAAFNKMGVDVAAIGNHDFDWTLDTLRQRMAESRYPWLSANIFDSLTGQRPAWAVPYAMVTKGGLRIAVVGYSEPETKELVKAGHLRGLRFGRGAGAIRDVLDDVRRQHPDVTVLLAHAGAVCDSAGCSGEIIDLARELGPGSADVIVAGHTHRLVNTIVAGIPIVEARWSGAALGIVDLARARGGGWRAWARVRVVEPDSVTPDAALAALVESYRRRTDSVANRVIATVKLPLPKRDGAAAQYELGQLIADAQRNATRADVAIVNNGSIRAPGLPAGAITYGQAFEVQPFEDQLVKLTVSGRLLKQALEHALAGDAPEAHVSGITVRYDLHRPVGKRIRQVHLTNGREVDDDGRYSLTVNDFIATGGDGYDMLVGAPAEQTGMVDLEALVRYLRRLPQPVEPPELGRLLPISR